uniref:uL15 family ribosomal protein n=1 Tax=Candidatus Fimenecus sp. TaxID=3022888 RepID=UPI004029AEF3
MELLNTVFFDSTKLAFGLGALFVILGVCLLWFGIVERRQINRRIKKENEQNLASLNNEADEAESANAVATVAEAIEECEDGFAVGNETIVDESGAETTVEEIVEEVVDEPAEEENIGVSVAEAHESMTDEAAESMVIVASGTSSPTTGRKAVVNIDTISANFNDGDTVDLDALKEKKLVSRKETAVKILARGRLNKQLNVVANDFSADAVKMICLMGGTATRV